MWGFLTEFWGSIASTTINAWEYSTSWFQNIGLAVAGAIGNLFDFALHFINDFFIFLGWLFSGLKELIGALTMPISYAYHFLSSMITGATTATSTPAVSYTFATSTMSVFESIPYWETLSYIIGVCILILSGIAIIRLLTKL